jgi:hypothetical protein
MNIKNALLLSFSIAVVLLAGACQQNFEPGREGRLPQGWNVDRYATWHEDRLLPGTQPGMPLACNDTWDLEAEAVQGVESCEEFDFTDLYDQAVSDGEAMAAEVECDPDCYDDHPRTQVSWSGLWCSGNEAYAAVMMNFLCRTTEADQFPLAERIPSDFTPQPVPTSPGAKPPASPVDFSSAARPSEVGCGSTEKVELDYKRGEREFACSSFDPDDLRASARDRAEWMYDRYPCASGCSKKPIDIHQEEWSCIEDLDRNENGSPDYARATVTVRFSVECEAD